MTTTISAPQAKTLRAIIAMGGEVNFYAGVKGLDSRCESALIRAGFITEPVTCDCYGGEHCNTEHAPLPHAGGQRCYRRTRITTEGRAAVAA